MGCVRSLGGSASITLPAAWRGGPREHGKSPQILGHQFRRSILSLIIEKKDVLRLLVERLFERWSSQDLLHDPCRLQRIRSSFFKGSCALLSSDRPAPLPGPEEVRRRQHNLEAVFVGGCCEI